MSRQNIVSIVSIAVVVLLSTTLDARQGGEPSLTGAWSFTVESSAGVGMPTVTFKQDGHSLTGHYSSTMFGEAELKGTVNGASVEFTVQASYQGQAMPLKFSGVVEGKDSMKGKSSSDLGESTFVAKRK
jgi:hypothetical protein